MHCSCTASGVGVSGGSYSGGILSMDRFTLEEPFGIATTSHLGARYRVHRQAHPAVVVRHSQVRDTESYCERQIYGTRRPIYTPDGAYLGPLSE